MLFHIFQLYCITDYTFTLYSILLFWIYYIVLVSRSLFLYSETKAVVAFLHQLLLSSFVRLPDVSVDIRNPAPVDMVYICYYLQGFLFMSGACFEFLPSTVGRCSEAVGFFQVPREELSYQFDRSPKRRGQASINLQWNFEQTMCFFVHTEGLKIPLTGFLCREIEIDFC